MGRSARRGTLAKTDRYPERRAGGYTRVDGTVEFYTRVRAVLAEIGEAAVVLDFGAGRGALSESPSLIHRRIADLRPAAAKVIGVDVDEAVRQNPLLTEAHVIARQGRLPLEDGSIDVVVADHALEHLTDPGPVARELGRVLRPGGWLCARTPNRRGYIALAARAVPAGLHRRVLRRVQPSRLEEDVFETEYRLNTPEAIAEHFPAPRFDDHVIYGWEPEPSYGANFAALRGLFAVMGRFTPESRRPILLVFLRRTTADGPELMRGHPRPSGAASRPQPRRA